MHLYEINAEIAMLLQQAAARPHMIRMGMGDEPPRHLSAERLNRGKEVLRLRLKAAVNHQQLAVFLKYERFADCIGYRPKHMKHSHLSSLLRIL